MGTVAKNTDSPFVYLWLHLPSGHWYIGSRTARGCHESDGYICSSKTVKAHILENPAEWVRTILYKGDKLSVLSTEKELLKRLKVVPNQLSLNAGYLVGMTHSWCLPAVGGAHMAKRKQIRAYIPQKGDKNRQYKGAILRCPVEGDEIPLLLEGTKAIKEAGYCSRSVYNAVAKGRVYQGYLWLRQSN
jgi:hypothetical protein